MLILMLTVLQVGAGNIWGLEGQMMSEPGWKIIKGLITSPCF